MAIESHTARANIFKEFYDLLRVNLVTPNVKVTNSFVDDIVEMPQVVIHAPQLPRQRNAFGTTVGAYDRSGNFEIDIFAKKMQTVVELVDDVENTIFSNLGDISVQNVQLGDSSSASIEVGGFQVHVITIPIAFKFSR